MSAKPAKGLEAGVPVKPKSSGHCPLCTKETVSEFRPFCSAHCKNLDLHRWLRGRYAIPTDEEDEAISDETSRH